MRRLDGYPYGKPLLKTPRTRVYENAAARRKGVLEYIPGQPFTLPSETGKVQNYPTYRSPFMNPFRTDGFHYDIPSLQSEGSESKERYEEGGLLPKLQTALQAYRVGSGAVGIHPSLQVEAIVQNMVTGNLFSENGEIVGTTMRKHHQKREEELRNHELELWKRFRLHHMLYVENDKFFYGMGEHRSGQVVNVIV